MSATLVCLWYAGPLPGQWEEGQLHFVIPNSLNVRNATVGAVNIRGAQQASGAETHELPGMNRYNSAKRPYPYLRSLFWRRLPLVRYHISYCLCLVKAQRRTEALAGLIRLQRCQTLSENMGSASPQPLQGTGPSPLPQAALLQSSLQT